MLIVLGRRRRLEVEVNRKKMTRRRVGGWGLKSLDRERRKEVQMMMMIEMM
jgi:hypothetical protein